MTIIKGLDEIRAAQTVKFPSHDDIRLRFPDYTAGVVSAVYSHNLQKWLMSYHETKEEAVEMYEQDKKLCEKFPDVFNWFEYSEMYVFVSRGYTKPKWALSFMVVDD